MSQLAVMTRRAPRLASAWHPRVSPLSCAFLRSPCNRFRMYSSATAKPSTHAAKWVWGCPHCCAQAASRETPVSETPSKTQSEIPPTTKSTTTEAPSFAKQLVLGIFVTVPVTFVWCYVLEKVGFGPK